MLHLQDAGTCLWRISLHFCTKLNQAATPRNVSKKHMRIFYFQYKKFSDDKILLPVKGTRYDLGPCLPFRNKSSTWESGDVPQLHPLCLQCLCMCMCLIHNQTSTALHFCSLCRILRRGLLRRRPVSWRWPQKPRLLPLELGLASSLPQCISQTKSSNQTL